MHKLEINDDIIKAYLMDQDLLIYAHNEVYSLENQTDISLFKEPNKDFVQNVKQLYEELLKKINPFSFPDEVKIANYIHNMNEVIDYITINLVVGFPKPITRFFRVAENDHIYLVLDLVNIINKNQNIMEDVNELYDYISYFLCLMALDIHTQISRSDALAVFNHSIYSASYAYYLSDSKQLERFKKDGLYDMLLYIEESMLKNILRKGKPGLIHNYLQNIFRTNPDLEFLGITGKVYLEKLKIKKDQKAIQNLFQKGSNAFVNKVESSSFIKKKASAYRLYAWFTVFLPLIAIGIVTWIIIEIIRGTFSIYLRYLPLVYGGVILTHQILKYRVRQTTLKRFLLYSLAIISLIIIYLLVLKVFIK